VHQFFVDLKKAYNSVSMEVLCNILIEFGIPMKVVRLIKMCLNETYNRARVGENLSEIFSVRDGLNNGDALKPLLFNFTLEYSIRRLQVNQDGLKLNGAPQLLVYVDNVNMLGGSVHTMKKNAEALIVASKETGLEVNADKTKYMVMSGDQSTGQSHNMKTDNRFLESVEEFKYLGRTLTNQNSIQEEMTSRLNSGNAYYRSVQNLLSSSLLSKNLKIKNKQNYNSDCFFLYGCETWSLTLKEERKMKAFENRMLRRIFGRRRDEVIGEWKKLHIEELYDLNSSSNSVPVIKSRRMKWTGHVALNGESRGVWRIQDFGEDT